METLFSNHCRNCLKRIIKWTKKRYTALRIKISEGFKNLKTQTIVSFGLKIIANIIIKHIFETLWQTFL